MGTRQARQRKAAEAHETGEVDRERCRRERDREKAKKGGPARTPREREVKQKWTKGKKGKEEPRKRKQDPNQATEKPKDQTEQKARTAGPREAQVDEKGESGRGKRGRAMHRKRAGRDRRPNATAW